MSFPYRRWRLAIALGSVVTGLAAWAQEKEPPPAPVPIPAGAPASPAVPIRVEPVSPGGVVTTPVPSAPHDGLYRLAYTFREGEIVRYDVLSEQEILSRESEVEETARNKTETKKHYRVVRVHPDGSADLEIVIDWFRMSIAFGDDPLEAKFDSGDPELQPKKMQHMLKVIGKPQAVMRFAATGKLISVDKIDADLKSNGSGQHSQTLGASGDSLQTFLMIVPDRRIKVGESWSDPFELRVQLEDGLTMPVKLRRTYTLESVNGSVATVAMKTTVLTAINSPRIEAQLIQRVTSGKIEFDLDRGVILKRSVSCRKQVIEPFGPKTLLHAKWSLVESLAPETTAQAAPSK